MNYDVIIIGGGPAGATAALYAARAQLRTIVVDKGVKSGALGITQKIANYPGVPGDVSGAGLVEIMRKQAESFGAEFRKARVTGAFLREDPKLVITAEGEEFTTRALILATGAMGRTSTVPGEEALLGRGVSYCATCDAAFFRNKRVLVAGSTHEAAEEALFLARFAREVVLVTPKPEPEMKEDLAATGKVEVRTGRKLARVEGNGKVAAAVVAAGREEERIPVDGVFIYGTGSKPITDFIQDEIEMTTGGCILINKMHETRAPGVFACGDLICNDVQQAVVAAAQGCIAALAADRYLNKREKPLKDYR